METPATPTKAKKLRKYQYDTITVREGGRPTPSSKYDFVKVKVWLEDHYYVLSRFLVSRVLNVTKVDQIDAVKIALELKKRLVDQGMMNVTQLEMENQLFQILKGYGYGNEYIQRYRMTTKFHHQRVPLIILITGTRCVGKSWLATQLAERLNLSTVLQTNLVYDLMYTIMRDLPDSVSSPYPKYNSVPLIYRAKDKDSLIEEYQRECKMVREGVETDIEKCLEEGKAIIIEGPNIDPSLFIELLQNRSIPVSSPLPSLLSPSFASPSAHHHNSHVYPIDLNTQVEPSMKSMNLSSRTRTTSSASVTSATPPIPIPTTAPTAIPPPTTTNIIKTPKDPVPPTRPQEFSNHNYTSTNTLPSTFDKDDNKSKEDKYKDINKEKGKDVDRDKDKENDKDKDKEKDKEKKEKKKQTGITKGIIVPFVLSVSATDHKLMVENWLSCSPRDQEFIKQLGPDPESQTNVLVARLQSLQEYLLRQAPPFHRVDVNTQSLLDTLSVLHSAVLDRIQQVYTDEGFGI